MQNAKKVIFPGELQSPLQQRGLFSIRKKIVCGVFHYSVRKAQLEFWILINNRGIDFRKMTVFQHSYCRSDIPLNCQANCQVLKLSTAVTNKAISQYCLKVCVICSGLIFLYKAPCKHPGVNSEQESFSHNRIISREKIMA